MVSVQEVPGCTHERSAESPSGWVHYLGWSCQAGSRVQMDLSTRDRSWVWVYKSIGESECTWISETRSCPIDWEVELYTGLSSRPTSPSCIPRTVSDRDTGVVYRSAGVYRPDRSGWPDRPKFAPGTGDRSRSARTAGRAADRAAAARSGASGGRTERPPGAIPGGRSGGRSAAGRYRRAAGFGRTARTIAATAAASADGTAARTAAAIRSPATGRRPAPASAVPSRTAIPYANAYPIFASRAAFAIGNGSVPDAIRARISARTRADFVPRSARSAAIADATADAIAAAIAGSFGSIAAGAAAGGTAGAPFGISTGVPVGVSDRATGGSLPRGNRPADTGPGYRSRKSYPGIRPGYPTERPPIRGSDVLPNGIFGPRPRTRSCLTAALFKPGLSLTSGPKQSA